MEMKINAVYKEGVLVPKIPLDLEENSNVEVVLKEKLSELFSIAGEDDDVEGCFDAQKEVVENDQ